MSGTIDTSTLVQEPPVGSATSEIDAESVGTGPNGLPLIRERVRIVEDVQTRRALEMQAISQADSAVLIQMKHSYEYLTLTDRRGSNGRGSTR